MNNMQGESGGRKSVQAKKVEQYAKELCNRGKAGAVWSRITGFLSGHIEKKFGELPEKLDNFAQMWYECCRLQQELKLRFQAVESWMKKSNRAKTQESLENIGLARSGTGKSAEASAEQPVQGVPGNRALQALQMRAARAAGLA